MILTRDQMMKGKGRIYKTVMFEDLDGELRLGSLTAGAALELNDLKSRITKGEAVEKEMMVLMLVDAIVDDDGKPLFDNDSAKEFLQKISPETMLKISRETPKSKAASEANLGNSKASTDSSPTV